MQWQEFRAHIRHLPTRDMGRLERAFLLGKKMHGTQKRKSGEPYFNHPIAVAHMLSDLGADADTLIAALLHDTVEDTALTLVEIDRELNGDTAPLIDGVTKLSSKDVAMSPRLDEQTETLRKIFKLMHEDVRIMVIKLVDRLHNMQTVEFLPTERQKALAKETLEVFVKIADKLCMQDLRDELEGLCLSVLEPDLYPKLSDVRTANEQRGVALIEHMKEKLRDHDRHLASRVQLTGEAKTWGQLKAQLNVGGGVATGVSFLTVALVVEDIDSAYRTLGALHQLWKREVLSFQDFINEPQLNGYRGLHTTVITQDGTRVRCKIRTKEMHGYARLGVATVCFKGTSEISEILPWTKRISPLAADTEGSSNNFWESLKGDILGETIIIHGPDDSTVQLPHDATALDGAFYMLQDRALSVQAIKVNGIEVPFSTVLANAASMDFVLSAHETASREWLRMVKTGFAAAKIRSALTKLSESKKLMVGREMLQKVFTERKRGFIEEFSEANLKSRLETLGLRNLNDVYVSIADGRLEPNDVHDALFDKPRNDISSKTPVSTIRYTVDTEAIDVMDRINLVHRKYGASLLDIRYRRSADNKMHITLQLRLLSGELATFKNEVRNAGANDISVVEDKKLWMLLILAVIVLWALNPVIAKWFLLQGMTPLSLVTIRFLTFFVYATCFYVSWRIFSRGTKFTPVPNLLLLTAPPALGLMGLSFFNYFALTQMPPSLHLTILRLNALLLPIVLSMRKGSRFQKSSLFTFVLFVLLLILIMSIPGAPPIEGLLLSILALFFYILYSLVSEHVLQQKQISVRYPLFVAHLGVLLGIAGFLLLPWQHAGDVINNFTLSVILYVVACVCIPHMFYSLLLRRISFTSFTDIFLLEVPFAIGFEGLLLSLTLPAPLYGVIGFILVILLLRRWKPFTFHAS